MDLADLAPAKGKVHPLSTPDGRVLLVHAQDLRQQKRLIPDLATWVQCFSLYTAIVCSKKPEPLTDLLGYMCQITKASQCIKWPSWVIYDQTFCQEAAERDIKGMGSAGTQPLCTMLHRPSKECRVMVQNMPFP